ncbi:MAG: hypothetical protein KKA05_04370 [Alphaproteobacteria bacterium]|nr:hypothetical protein [Alphaproteobacteria bacterium]
MRVTLKDLMDKLAVGYVLGPYETFPWSYYDGETGVTCSAEVRMGADSDEVEAEIQVMYDTPPAGKQAMEHICYIRSAPGGQDGMWEILTLRVKGEPLKEDVYNWQEKSCTFFTAVVRALLIETIPDIDELIEDIFHNYERFHDQYGGGGGKSPKIRPSQLMDLKKGRGF